MLYGCKNTNELTPKNAGLTIWGDPQTLSDISMLLAQINATSPVIKNREGFCKKLSVDFFRACSGNIKQSNIKIKTKEYEVLGLNILWPVLITQVGVVRASMSFIPTTKKDQALTYELEHLVESATGALLPNYKDRIMRIITHVYQNPSFVEDVLNSRCIYFINLPPHRRLLRLVPILKTLDPVEHLLNQIFYGAGVADRRSIPYKEFEQYANCQEWPEIEW